MRNERLFQSFRDGSRGPVVRPRGPRLAGIRKSALGAAVLLIAVIVLEAASLSVSGSWSVSIGQSNLAGSAGSDLTPTYTSATNQATMSVSGAAGHNWRIDVYRQDTTWNAGLHLRLMRTNNGTSGTGTYSGGTTFLEVMTTTQTWMTGSGNRSGFTLQFQLTGVSCAVPAASYSASIVYTIVQTS
jgi:hypothetical protein